MARSSTINIHSAWLRTQAKSYRLALVRLSEKTSTRASVRAGLVSHLNKQLDLSIQDYIEAVSWQINGLPSNSKLRKDLRSLVSLSREATSQAFGEEALERFERRVSAADDLRERLKSVLLTVDSYSTFLGGEELEGELLNEMIESIIEACGVYLDLLED